MIRPLASLGRFIFAPTTGSYESLQKAWEFSWAKQEVIGAATTKQWTGPKDHQITIGGSVWPEIQTGTTWKLEKIAQEAHHGRPMALVGFSGQVYGQFVLDGLNVDQRLIGVGGIPGEISFIINLSRAL